MLSCREYLECSKSVGLSQSQDNCEHSTTCLVCCDEYSLESDGHTSLNGEVDPTYSINGEHMPQHSVSACHGLETLTSSQANPEGSTRRGEAHGQQQHADGGEAVRHSERRRQQDGHLLTIPGGVTQVRLSFTCQKPSTS